MNIVALRERAARYNLDPLGVQVYVDDLPTLPQARRQGHGRRLLDWLEAEAERAGCGQIHGT
jgi:GNAT superfamily N-acetyltransferase